MVDWIFGAIMVWHAILMLMLLVHAVRSREIVATLIAFDAVSLVLLSALVVLAAHRREVSFIEIALVLALVVFAQTLAAARLLKIRRIGE
ncbi:MAG TPA: monovalent cation/H+ antiporter complex subunit F [Paracoccaceae bacterium]|nr:monovalent cation/H+ antiporter complex subunit F [Paracoccaceae bacterium]